MKKLVALSLCLTTISSSLISVLTHYGNVSDINLNSHLKNVSDSKFLNLSSKFSLDTSNLIKSFQNSVVKILTELNNKRIIEKIANKSHEPVRTNFFGINPNQTYDAFIIGVDIPESNSSMELVFRTSDLYLQGYITNVDFVKTYLYFSDSSIQHISNDIKSSNMGYGSNYNVLIGSDKLNVSTNSILDAFTGLASGKAQTQKVTQKRLVLTILATAETFRFREIRYSIENIINTGSTVDWQTGFKRIVTNWGQAGHAADQYLADHNGNITGFNYTDWGQVLILLLSYHLDNCGRSNLSKSLVGTSGPSCYVTDPRFGNEISDNFKYKYSDDYTSRGEDSSMTRKILNWTQYANDWSSFEEKYPVLNFYGSMGVGIGAGRVDSNISDYKEFTSKIKLDEDRTLCLAIQRFDDSKNYIDLKFYIWYDEQNIYCQWKMFAKGRNADHLQLDISNITFQEYNSLDNSAFSENVNYHYQDTFSSSTHFGENVYVFNYKEITGLNWQDFSQKYNIFRLYSPNLLEAALTPTDAPSVISFPQIFTDQIPDNSDTPLNIEDSVQNSNTDYTTVDLHFCHDSNSIYINWDGWFAGPHANLAAVNLYKTLFSSNMLLD